MRYTTVLFLFALALGGCDKDDAKPEPAAVDAPAEATGTADNDAADNDAAEASDAASPVDG